jgi:uncharacterized membrane protein
MFGTHKKLKAWNAAGLITTDQLSAITIHEKNRQAGRLGRNIVGVALFAIIIGILSLVAANWLAIPGSVKITVHLLLNLGLAATIWMAHARGKEIVREGALLVLGGLTLTLIALIGQVFQLGGSLSGALLVWQLAILPAFILFGQTRLTVLPGLLSLIGSVTLIMFEALEGLPDFWQVFYIVMLGVLMPLCLIADGYVKMFRRLRPVWCETSQRVGFVLLTLTASFASLFWYEDRGKEMFRDIAAAGLSVQQGYLILMAVFVVALVGMFVHSVVYKRNAEDPRFYQLTWFYTLASVVMMGLPILFPDLQSDFIGMLAFVLYWGFIAWYAQTTGAMRLLSLAIFLLALRVWIIYLEAFGGLMSTGFGLISGGVLMLVMMYGARKVNTRLTGKGTAHV